MSQAKVDQYKQEKANRKQTMAKAKTKGMIAKVCASVVGVVLVAWIAVSTVSVIIESRPVHTHYVKMDAISDYFDKLQPEDTEDKEDNKTSESTESTETTETTEE